MEDLPSTVGRINADALLVIHEDPRYYLSFTHDDFLFMILMQCDAFAKTFAM
jgi:hypothetical protein